MKNKMTRLTDSKKAAEQVLIISIISVVILMLITVFAYKYYVSMKERLEAQGCKNSIEAHSYFAQMSARILSADIKCPTKNMTIDVDSRKDPKKIIAEDMYRCWYEWNQGDGEWFEGEGSFCHICTIYSFEQQDREIHEFTTFLLTEKISAKYDVTKKGMTYAEYFQGYKSEDVPEKVKDAEFRKAVEQDSFATANDYATIIIYAAGDEPMHKALKIIDNRPVIERRRSVAFGVSNAKGVSEFFTIMNMGPTTYALYHDDLVVGTFLASTVAYELYDLVMPDDPEHIAMIVFTEYDSKSLSEIGCERLEVNQQSHSEK